MASGGGRAGRQWRADCGEPGALGELKDCECRLFGSAVSASVGGDGEGVVGAGRREVNESVWRDKG